MRSIPRSARFVRFVVAAAVLASPLVSAGVAQAALAGASAQTSTRPDLRSATIVAGSATPQVRYCFDESLGSSLTLTPTNFRIGGYRSGTFLNGAIANYDQNNENCVIITFSTASGGGSGPVDLASYSIAQVSANAVIKRLTPGTLNDADSTALQGGTSQNGTRGRSAAPDLIGVSVDSTNQQITYIYDQNVVPVGPPPTPTNAGRFWFVDGTGALVPAQAYACAQNGCVASFSGTPSVGNAQIAGNDALAVTSANLTPTTTNQIQHVIVPGKAGELGNPPRLVSSELTNANGNTTTMDFTFDGPVSNPSFGNFFAVLSDSSILTGVSAAIVGAPGTTVRVTFTGLQDRSEYVVRGAVSDGAVQDRDTATNSRRGGVPSGGNAGAFSSGFTTGPDAFSVAFNPSSAEATVTFDQRVYSSTPSQFFLLNGDGDRIGASAQGATFAPGAVPGASTVTTQFTQAQFTGAVALEIVGPTNGGSAVRTMLGGADAGNIQQIVQAGAGAGLQSFRRSGAQRRLKASLVRASRVSVRRAMR